MHRILPVFLLLSGCPKKAVEPSLAAPQDLTVELLNQWVVEVCHLIEEEAGAEFATTPHVRIATPVELSQVVVEEAVVMQAAEYPDVPERVFRAQLEGQQFPGIMGKYGIFTEVMYVDIDSIWGMAMEKNWGVEGVPRVAKVLLAHELVHALQAQAADSDEVWDKLPDSDAFEAYRSVTEGQASWVERRVATRLLSDDVAEAMIEMQGWSFEEGPIHPAAFGIWSAYGQGDVFMQGLHAEGGTDLQWKAVAEPPAKSAMIFGTEPYSADYEPPPSGMPLRFKGLESKLGQGTWMATEGRVGEVHLRQSLYGHGDAALPHIHAVEHAWTRDAKLPDRQVGLGEMVFRDAEAASAFLGLLRASPEVNPSESVEALELGDESIVVTTAPGAQDGQGSLSQNETRVYAARKGRAVVVLTCVAFRPGKRGQEVLTAMLARLEEP